MKFSQRFALYLFGFVIGVGFVYFIWNKKSASFNYLPNARVLENIKSKPFYYSEAALLQLKDQKLDTSAIKLCLNNGDVDFHKSNRDTLGGKKYIIKDKNVIIEVINYSDRAILEKIEKK